MNGSGAPSDRPDGLRSGILRRLRRRPLDAAAGSCSWDVLCATYEEQAARGVPEAIAGLERLRDGRWPSSGLPRRR